MRNQKKYIFYTIVFICFLVAILTSLYMHKIMGTRWYNSLPVSRLMPSRNIFVLLWISSFAIVFSAYLLTREETSSLLYDLGETLYLALLLMCLLWPISFFYFQSPLLGIFNLVIVLLTTFLTTAVFFKISSSSMSLMIFYISILSFVFHSNLYIVLKSYNLIN